MTDRLTGSAYVGITSLRTGAKIHEWTAPSSMHATCGVSLIAVDEIPLDTYEISDLCSKCFGYRIDDHRESRGVTSTQEVQP
jgi:hypothetical protein